MSACAAGAVASTPTAINATVSERERKRFVVMVAQGTGRDLMRQLPSGPSELYLNRRYCHGDVSPRWSWCVDKDTCTRKFTFEEPRIANPAALELFNAKDLLAAFRQWPLVNSCSVASTEKPLWFGITRTRHGARAALL